MRTLILTIGLLIAGIPAEQQSKPDRPFFIDKEGTCFFAPRIEAALTKLVDRSEKRVERDGGPEQYSDRQAMAFDFGRLHAVGIVAERDGVWDESRVYFREDLPALRVELRRLGFRIDRHDMVLGTSLFRDDMGYYAQLHAIDMRRTDGNFSDAQSYLSCGSP
jgi:hypothetical protein